MKCTIGTALSGLCGLITGIVLALLWHLVTFFILTSVYDAFWGDVYAIIIDCSIGAILGTFGGICISLYCPSVRRMGLLLGLASVILLVPAVVWDSVGFPMHIIVNGSALSFDAFTNRVWYLLLWGLPAISISTGFLCRRTLLGKVSIALAITHVAFGFLPLFSLPSPTD